MSASAHTHASPRRDAAPYSDSATGEVRVPLSLYRVDEQLDDVDLVLSRQEGERLVERIQSALARSVETVVLRRPEVVQ